MTALLRAALAAAFLAAGPAAAEVYRDRAVEIFAVPALDIQRYMGRWFEIARFPNAFEKGCAGVTADYSLREDGRIEVLNTCREGGMDGMIRIAKGIAKPRGEGRLTVNFGGWLPFARGDYWVLFIDADYTLAAVGAPKGKTGWILARTPTISAEDRARAEAALRANGYDTDKLEDVAQALR